MMPTANTASNSKVRGKDQFAEFRTKMSEKKVNPHQVQHRRTSSMQVPGPVV
jgi:hypothetical protein